MTERRIARRYDVSVPVRVRDLDKQRDGAPSGKTRDISTSGLYFTLPQQIEPGSRIEMTLTLPAAITGGSEVVVEVVGRVVRVEDGRGADHQSVGVAAHIERYDIVRAGVTR